MTVADGPATIVTQTRARDDSSAAFAAWQSEIGAAVARQAGFIEQKVIPPNPPAQTDWVILQRFTSAEAAAGWLRSDERLRIVEQAQPMLLGNDDVHVIRDGAAGPSPAPISAVISTRVRPGCEEAFRKWEHRIATAQAKSPGFQGYRFEPPMPGVQDDYVAILRFDSEANLQTWFDSPVRKQLLAESEPLVEQFTSRIVRSGFEQWFGGTSGGAQAPVWKQNMIVLLHLYPVVFLFGAWVMTPLLMGRMALPFWLALFIANVISIILLNYMVPWTSQRFGWWLQPKSDRGMRTTLAGTALVVGLYAVLFGIFSRF